MTERMLLATRNEGKIAELRAILAQTGADVELVGLDAYPDLPEVVETETTFAGNALLKARFARDHTGVAAIADDSGVAVDVLGGMPGFLSALWAGRHGDDQANLELLLAQLHDLPDDLLTASFVCVAAAVFPDGREIVCEGRMPGRIVREPRGEGGFGYDPIFVPDGEDRTSAELSPAEKNAISHRGQAFRQLAAKLVG